MITFSPRHFYPLLDKVYREGNKVPSERGMTYEIQDMLLSVEDPRDRIVTAEWRKMNIGFAIVDALSHIVGDSSLAPLTQFVPGFSAYSTNGRTIDGAYSERIHTNEQLSMVIDMLKKNPETRRAVISIYMGPVDLAGGGGLNTPCTLNMHFLVRNGRLNMKVMMRSNDIMLGLTNDLFTFTMLQEYVSIKTGIPLGTYSHFASSFHLYESDLYKYRSVKDNPIWAWTMGSMPSDFDPVRVYSHISNLKKLTMRDCLHLYNNGIESEYEKDLFLAAASVYFRKQEGGATTLTSLISDRTLRLMSYRWTRIGETA